MGGDRAEDEAVAAALGALTCQQCGTLLYGANHRRRRRTYLLAWRFCTKACQTAARRALAKELGVEDWVRDDAA